MLCFCDYQPCSQLIWTAMIWITFCFGLRQISKTSCSISEPTLTTIGRMTHWKDERRIRPCLGQSQISARSVGNPTVAPCTRRRWPPDLSESRPGCGIRSTSAELPRNRSLFSYCNASPIGSIPCYRCVPKVELITLSQRDER